MSNSKHTYILIFSFLLSGFCLNLKQLNASSMVFYPDNIVMTGNDECSFVKDLEKDQSIPGSNNLEKSKINKMSSGKPSFSKAALIELKSPDGSVGSLVVTNKICFRKYGSFLKKELGIKENASIIHGKNWISASDLKVGDKIKGFADEVLMINEIDFFHVDKDDLFYELDVFGDFYLVDSVGHKVLVLYLSRGDYIFGSFILLTPVIGLLLGFLFAD